MSAPGYVCLRCGVEFSTYETLLLHDKTMHGEWSEDGREFGLGFGILIALIFSAVFYLGLFSWCCVD